MKEHANPALSGAIIPTFFYYVIPSIIGLVAITTANLVDGMFVGNAVGAEALAAITLLLPYLTFLFAIGLMLSIGGSVSAGKYVGEGNLKAASRIFSQCLIATVVINLLFAAASLLFEEWLYALLNAPTEIQPLIDEYLSIIRWVMVVQTLSMVLYYFIRADGHPILATTALVIGALLNIIFDAWFIIHLEMGLAGAAYATAIAQVIQLIVLGYYFISHKRTLMFSLLTDKWNELLRAAYNGLSEFINELSVGLIFLLLNGLLIARIGIDGVAAFSVVNYFIFLSIMLSYGIADALHLLVSQNFGAKNHQRMKQFLTTAITSTLVLGITLIVLLLQWQNTAINWFLKEDAEEVITLAGTLLWLIWPLFLVNGINIILSCYLTAIHQPKPSAIIATARSLVLPALLLSIFYMLFDDWKFLTALPIAEWCTFLLAVVLVAKRWKST